MLAQQFQVFSSIQLTLDAITRSEGSDLVNVAVLGNGIEDRVVEDGDVVRHLVTFHAAPRAEEEPGATAPLAAASTATRPNDSSCEGTATRSLAWNHRGSSVRATGGATCTMSAIPSCPASRATRTTSLS